MVPEIAFFRSGTQPIRFKFGSNSSSSANSCSKANMTSNLKHCTVGPLWKYEREWGRKLQLDLDLSRDLQLQQFSMFRVRFYVKFDRERGRELHLELDYFFSGSAAEGAALSNPPTPRHEGGGVWVNKKPSFRRIVVKNSS